jgi:hypothetical protein
MWTFIVCRNNYIERIKCFQDQYSAADYAKKYVEGLFSDSDNIPNFLSGDCYRDDDGLSIGIYMCE